MGVYMDLMGRLERVNRYGKKQCRSLFWRVKAAMKKGILKSRCEKQLKKFQYDPSSYALNFDDSGVGGANTIRLAPTRDSSLYQNDIIWVYVLRVKS